MTSVGSTLGSIVIPAWNEAAVIQRTLDAVFDGVATGAVEVVVACNGCTDGTPDIARRSGHPIQVLELGPVGKARAIRAGEDAAPQLPRIYLDADTELPGSAAVAVLEHLSSAGGAARPPVAYDLQGCTWPVRSYYSVRSEIPAIAGALYGAGVYGLGADIRARFAEFPDVVADDLFAARIAAPNEVVILDCPAVTVRVPRTSRALVSTLARVHRGNRQLASDAPELAPPTGAQTLRDVLALARSPRRALDVAAYVTLTLLGRVLSRAGGTAWARDDTARGVLAGKR